MKTPTLFLALSLCIAPSLLTAQSSVWKVSKGDDSLYIGGTCHLLRKADFPLPKEFDLAYAESEKLVFEVDPSDLQDPSFAMRLMAESSYKDGQTLKSVLSPEAYTALEAQCKKSNFPIALIENIKPGMALMMITLQELAKTGVTQEGVDIYYANKGKLDGKSVGGLESAEFQLNLITSMADGIESEFVTFSLKDLDQIGTLFDDIITAWRHGKLDTIEEVFVKDLAEFPKLYDAMLKERNDRWLPQIQAMLKDEAMEFILVGVGHLAGKHGVLQQLKAKGYTVEQVVASE